MAKIDKEALAKHSFWIVLGSFLLLWLIAMITLLAGAGGAVEAKKADYEKARDTIKKLEGGNIPADAPGKMATQAFTEVWSRREKKLVRQKDKVWVSAWSDQDEKLATRPPGPSLRKPSSPGRLTWAFTSIRDPI